MMGLSTGSKPNTIREALGFAEKKAMHGRIQIIKPVFWEATDQLDL